MGNLVPNTLSAYRLPKHTAGFVTQKDIPTTIVIVLDLSMLLMPIASITFSLMQFSIMLWITLLSITLSAIRLPAYTACFVTIYHKYLLLSDRRLH